MNDNYVYQLEQALTQLLDQFEATEGDFKYIIYDEDGEPYMVCNEALAEAIEAANAVLYGDELEDDD